MYIKILGAIVIIKKNRDVKKLDIPSKNSQKIGQKNTFIFLCLKEGNFIEY